MVIGVCEEVGGAIDEAGSLVLRKQVVDERHVLVIVHLTCLVHVLVDFPEVGEHWESSSQVGLEPTDLVY